MTLYSTFKFQKALINDSSNDNEKNTKCSTVLTASKSIDLFIGYIPSLQLHTSYNTCIVIAMEKVILGYLRPSNIPAR